MFTKRGTRQDADGFVLETAEPCGCEDELREETLRLWAFPRGLSRDSAALTPIAIAGTPLIVVAGCFYSMAGNGSHPLLWAIVGACALIIVALVALSAAIFSRDRRRLLSAPSDFFAANGCLFSISWVDDRKAHGTSGKGILRIHAVRLDECRAYHSERDRVIWLIPARPGALRDIWRRDKTWEQRRGICEKLLKTGSVATAGDTDPFLGASEVYRPFLEDLGLRIEETARPVDLLAGTARTNAPGPWSD